jgi:hypothetical protein
MLTLHCLLFLYIATVCTAQDCEVRPEAKVFVKGEPLTVDETLFSKHYVSYPPNDTIEHKADDLSYYILNKEKKVLYIPNFLNETVAEEIKTFCIEGERFTQSHIRGTGDGTSVEKNDLRTR